MFGNLGKLGALGDLAAHVNPESLSILANLAQHLKQSEKPGEELLRLLRIIDKQLKPALRIDAKKKEA